MMKNAPNMSKLPPDLFTEAIIFAGEKAWTFAEDWQRNNTIGDMVPPVYLGKKQLDELHNLNIVDTGRRYVRVYRAGVISEKHISIIATKLALAGVLQARFYSESQELLEDWTHRLTTLKADAEKGNSVVVSLPVRGKKQQPVTDDDLKPRIESRDDGVYWVMPKVDKESGGVTINESWLCSPLDVLSIGSDGKDRYWLG